MLKSNLPESIVLSDGTELFPVIGGHVKQQMFYGAPTTIAALIAEAKRRRMRYRRVEVLHRNLRGKLDLHGQPYRPTKWVFVEAMPTTQPKGDKMMSTRADFNDQISRLRRTAKQLEQSPRIEAQTEAKQCRNEADQLERYIAPSDGDDAIPEVRPTKHDPHCDCGICAYCNGQEDVFGNPSRKAQLPRAPATTQAEAEVLRPWAERAASRIWQMVNDRGQDALSHVDYAQIIREEFDADFKEALLRA